MKIPINSASDVGIIHKEMKRLGFRKLPSKTSKHDNWIVFHDGFWFGQISDTGLSFHKQISINQLKEMK